MTAPAAGADWPDRLASLVSTHDGGLRRAIVVRETGSTQDAARRMAAEPGDAIVAVRQTGGRGRQGRRWTDTGDAGVAVTLVWSISTPQRLAIASAVGVARAVEPILGRPVGIKWPNDILVDGRKLAGILVEQTSDRAYIGVGLNVGEVAWPTDLADRAVSLHDLDASVARIDVIVALLPALAGALVLAEPELRTAFETRDVLTGTSARFRSGDAVVDGRVIRVDHAGAIVVDTGDQQVELDAATWTRDRG